MSSLGIDKSAHVDSRKVLSCSFPRGNVSETRSKDATILENLTNRSTNRSHVSLTEPVEASLAVF